MLPMQPVLLRSWFARRYFTDLILRLLITVLLLAVAARLAG